MRFLGLGVYSKVPDSNTIWNFREQLSKEDSVKKLFALFHKELTKQGMIINKGKIVDASIIDAPVQRNSREENRLIKEGGIPDNFKENPHKSSHKDTDARWTKKNNEIFYGYKNHIKADTGSKFIDDYTVTSANIHHSQGLEQLLDEKDKGQPLYADSAYSGEEIEGMVSKAEMINQIHEKGYRNNPLTETQQEGNRKKSKVRARVEHIFGFMENSMKGSWIRTIGIARAKMNIGLTNLVYNICRAVQLKINMHAVG